MTIKTLWTEAYRPDNVDGYVFRDDGQKAQIQSWISDQSIPHLLFSGSAGLGKCLSFEELIDVEIDITNLTPEQLKLLSKYKN